MTSGAIDAGLARERTSLAWTRTALALVVNGGLVLLRHEDAFPLAVSIVLAALAGLVALLAVTHGRRRRAITTQADDEVTVATGAVVSLGVSVTLLCLLTALALTIWP